MARGVKGSAVHGLRGTYIASGCRCQPCTAANSRFQRTRRNSGREAPSHGLSGYNNYGCRCLACTEAKQVANAAERARRMATAA